jgi:hypothetical protein
MQMMPSIKPFVNLASEDGKPQRIVWKWGFDAVTE